MVKMDTTGPPEGTEETAKMAKMAKMVLRLSIIFDEKITLVFSYKAQFLCRMSFVYLFTISNLKCKNVSQTGSGGRGGRIL